MKFNTFQFLAVLLSLGACGQEGAECASDDDCAKGLECHLHDEHEEGEHDEDGEHDDHGDDEEKVGECEAHEDE